MGVESAELSYFCGSVSATALVPPFALTDSEGSHAQQHPAGETVAAISACAGRHGSCLLVRWEDAARQGGLVNEETAA